MIATVLINDKGTIEAGKENLRNRIKSCGERSGMYIIRITYAGQPKSIKEARKYYFAICDMVADESNMGLTKKDVHNAIKSVVLSELNCTSTRDLTLEDWILFIDNVKKFLKEEFNFYL